MSVSASSLNQRQRRLAAAGVAVFLLLGAIQALYGPALPSIRATFGVGTAASGWTVGAHYCGAVIGVIASVYVEIRLEARTRLALGLVAVGIGSLAFAVIPTWPWALTGAALIGVGYGILVVAVNALVASGFGERNAAPLILVNAAFGLGAVLGPLSFGLLTSGDFRPAFVLAAVIAVLILPLGWSVPEAQATERAVAVPAGRNVLVVICAFVALFLLYTALESDTSGWMATHLVFHGYSRATAAGLTAGFWAALTLGRLLTVPIGSRITPPRIIAVSLVGILAFSLLTLMAPRTLAPITYMLIGLLLAPIFPLSFAWMARSLPGLRGTASLALLGALAGGLIFPVLVGQLIGAGTPDLLPAALAALATGTLVVSVILARRAVTDAT